ncbi:ATP-binding cassette domain-containing protein [Tunturibacter empetritectus]|uniref:Osmoprotectant transport system ATP-binding protein n=1 Tax=Tunturiibacter empetritectus TaxID=3069691 RepID=A0A7W8IDY2_9BACT|nr:ATP-binding cassette domain-containing protein [Edaphobacter lichenicola]MBB5315395.1 osmoprotectant transport system ATP-binding protein [Edaphobacter lichenicola]
MPTVGVEFAKVSYTLAGGRVLLRDISLQLEAGTTTALLGRSGSGKTTLLRMVNNLVTPSTGEVLVAGQQTRDADTIALRRSIGYVIQETGLFPHMTVERNAGMTLELAGRSKDEIATRVRDVMSLVGLEYEEFRRRYPWQLSGGQRQRVGLARALATDPTVLLMDEPLGALDPLTRAEMQTMLRDLLKKVGKTVLLVTHDLDEALYLARRVVFLSEGAVVADLAAEEVLQSENPHVKDYVQAVHRTVQA